MLIGLHDAELEYMPHKTFPNYALMKISAYHKAMGDTVEWWKPLETYDQVYSSKVFDFTPKTPYLPVDTIRGGTGYPDVSIRQQLAPAIDNIYPDYSIYPACDYAIGYITRGCPNHCRWCCVPAKEGDIRPYRHWQELVRPDSQKLVLMDNNILASDFGIAELESLTGSGYAIDLNQGMDARLLDEHIAKILAGLKWIRFIRFSCDQQAQIEPIYKTVELLGKFGIKPYRLFVYLLVRADIEDAARRVEALKKLGNITIYAQAERNERLGIRPSKMQLEFARRYVYSGIYRKENWTEYLERRQKLLSQREVITDAFAYGAGVGGAAGGSGYKGAHR